MCDLGIGHLLPIMNQEVLLVNQAPSKLMTDGLTTLLSRCVLEILGILKKVITEIIWWELVYVTILQKLHKPEDRAPKPTNPVARVS